MILGSARHSLSKAFRKTPREIVGKLVSNVSFSESLLSKVANFRRLDFRRFLESGPRSSPRREFGRKSAGPFS